MITCKKFVLLGSRFVTKKFSYVIASDRLSEMKKLINTLNWKNTNKYISADRSYLYCIFTTHMTLIWQKKVNKRLYRISSFLEYLKSIGTALGQLTSRKIDANPKCNPNPYPNPNSTRGQFSSEEIVQIPCESMGFCQQIPGGNLFHLAWMKIYFPM